MLAYQPQTAEGIFLNFVALIYESVVISIAIVMLILVYLKYQEKRHELTLYLFAIFIFYFLGVLFSLLSKVFVVSGIDTMIDGNTPLGWIFFRIMSFRVAELMICIAIFISYVLKIKLFHEGYNKIQKYIVIVVGLFTSFFVFFIYRFQDDSFSVLLDVIAFLFTFIFMGLIYIPFAYRAIEASRNVKNPEYKIAFLSLSIMSICYILVFFSFFLDRLLILIFDIIGFTFFYFSAWAFAIGAIFGAYFGYIRPRAGESQK